MRTLASLIAVFFVSLALSGCGGDSGSGCGHLTGSGSASTCGTGSTPGGGSTTPTASTLTVTSTAASIPADGSGSATITVLAKDANNNAVSGVPVTLAASSGTLSSLSGTTTSATGVITATLAATGASAGSAITVTATSGSVTGKVTVNVVATQQTLTLQTSSPQEPSNNSAPVIITATVLDANNKVLTGVPVSFSATSGAVAAVQTKAGATANVTAGTTDASGQAQATIGTAGDPTNRTITVTAALANGSTTSNITVAVIGTTLTVTGPASLVQGSVGTFNVALTDSAGTGIAGKTAALTSALKNPLSVASVTTDNAGHATFTVTGVTAGNETITATALGLTGTAAVSVSGQSFNFTAPAANTLVTLNATQDVTIVWKNNGAPVANAAVTFGTTRGSFVGGTGTITVNTDGTGTAKATVSSAKAGSAFITANATGVAASLGINFVATTPARMTLQSSPATIATGGQSTISAIVWDTDDNLVEGQTVYFQVTDPTGGTLKTGYAQTNLQGVAQVVYQASSTPSAANGVVINATVGSVTGQTSLTVGGEALSLVFATGSHVTESANKTQFILPYTVTVYDAAGHGVPGVSVALTIHSFPQVDVPSSFLFNDSNAPTTYGSTTPSFAAYAKGFWSTPATPDPNSTTTPQATLCSESLGGIVGTAYCQVIVAYCYNEDVDGSGILQNSQEDVNSNHQLDPRDVATVVADPTNPGITTDANGNAVFTVVYPENSAGWIQVLLTGTATVSGTEYATRSQFYLPILADYVNSTSNGTPPGYISPWGQSNQCRNPQ